MPVKDGKVWQFIEQLLSEKKKICLLTVVASTAGSPGRTGFKMAVAEDGRTSGTIGGGVMEFKLIKRCQDLLADGSSPQIIRQVHDNRTPRVEERSGLICSGEQTLAFMPLTPGQLPVVRSIVALSFDATRPILHLSPGGIILVEGTHAPQFAFSFSSNEDWSYDEVLGPAAKLYIVGGGHVGLALSRIAATLDFHITIFDHRPDLDTLKENLFAHDKVIAEYDRLGDLIEEGDHSYVAIVSTNFKTDEAALRAVLPKRLGYLGIMGSRAKIDHLWQILEKDGFSKERLSQVHAPIGLTIHSQTVEEIAISIAAEIIKHRNRGMPSSKD